jgi:hypothetical protein
MAAASGDPYKVLGVRPGASDEQVRAAYRRLVQIHHPDHNDGSPTAARRFEEIQEAYARIRRLRKLPPNAGRTPPSTSNDPAIDLRLADLEAQVRAATVARERARRAAASATAAERPERPSDEELGYVRTDDSFTKILADARAELADRLEESAHDQPLRARVARLLDDVADALRADGK